MNSSIIVTGLGLVSGRGTPRRVPDEALASIQDVPNVRRMSRVSQFAFAAARQAIRDAGWGAPDDHPQDDAGIVCASTHLSTSYGLEIHKGFLSEGKPILAPTHFSNGCFNSASSHISIEYKLSGCNHTITGGSNAGLHALSVAERLLQHGPCNRILCVAAEELTDVLLGAYTQFRLIPPLIPGEGAAALILEREETARARGAKPLARLTGTYLARGPDIRHDIEGRGIGRAIEALLPAGGTDLYLSCANGSDLDSRERSALRGFDSIRSTGAIKESLGEGFAFTSLAQAVTGLQTIRQGGARTCLAVSYDRQGDVSAASFSTFE